MRGTAIILRGTTINVRYIIVQFQKGPAISSTSRSSSFSMHATTQANQPKEIALAWLTRFSDGVCAADISRTVDTFLPHGWLRDVLVFTWDTRSLEGTAKIASYLSLNLKSGYISDVKLYEDMHVQPAFFPAGPDTGLEVPFDFETPVAFGKGFARLVRDVNGEWKALSVCVFVRDLKGHEEANYELGIYGNHTLAWEDVYAERRTKVEKEPEVLIGAFKVASRVVRLC